MRIKLFITAVFLMTASVMSYAKPLLYPIPVNIQFIPDYFQSFQNMTVANVSIINNNGIAAVYSGSIPTSPYLVPAGGATFYQAFRLYGAGEPVKTTPASFTISYTIYPSGFYKYTVQLTPGSSTFVGNTQPSVPTGGMSTCAFRTLNNTNTIQITCDPLLN